MASSAVTTIDPFYGDDFGVGDTNDSITTAKPFDECEYVQSYMLQKVIVVMIIGTTVASISVIENTFLCFVFLRQREIYRSSLIYPAVLSVLDVILSISYIMLMSMAVFMDYLNSVQLYFAWIYYLKETFVVSHVSMAASGFLIVFWTAERWLSIVKASTKLSAPGRRAGAIATAIVLGFLTKGTIYWEIEIGVKEECTNQNRYHVAPSALSSNWYYQTIFMFYLRNAMVVFLPFIALATFNVSIIRHLRRTAQITNGLAAGSSTAAAHASLLLNNNVPSTPVHQFNNNNQPLIFQPPPSSFSASLSPYSPSTTAPSSFPPSAFNANNNNNHFLSVPGPPQQQQQQQHQRRLRENSTFPDEYILGANGEVILRNGPLMGSKQSARDSINTLASIVTLYLLGNVVNVVITSIEHVDKSFLMSPGVVHIYAAVADLISLFTIICSAIRLPLYLITNGAVRKEVMKAVRTLFCTERMRKSSRQILRSSRGGGPGCSVGGVDGQGRHHRQSSGGKRSSVKVVTTMTTTANNQWNGKKNGDNAAAAAAAPPLHPFPTSSSSIAPKKRSTAPIVKNNDVTAATATTDEPFYHSSTKEISSSDQQNQRQPNNSSRKSHHGRSRSYHGCAYRLMPSLPSEANNCLLTRAGSFSQQQQSSINPHPSSISIRNGLYNNNSNNNHNISTNNYHRHHQQPHYHTTTQNGFVSVCIVDENEVDIVTPFESTV